MKEWDDLPRRTRPRGSGLGIASLLISIGAATAIAISSIISSRFSGSGTTYSERANYVFGAISGLLGLGGFHMSVIGFVLGFVGLLQGDRRKLLSILGLIFNGMIVASIVGSIFVLVFFGDR